MKKVLTAVFYAILLVTSCQKEIGKGEITPVTDGTITLSVSASLPDYDNETKGSLVNTVRLAWANGDVVYVYDNKKCLGTLTAALEDDSNKYAVLSGTISNSAAEKLTLVAASEGMAPSVTTQDAPIAGGITFNLATQDKAGAPYVAYSVIDKPASTEASGIKTAFQLATSVIKVNCTGVKGGTPVSQVRIKGVNTSLCLVPSASAAPAVSSSEGEGMITRTNASSFAGASGEGIMSFSVAVLEQDANADRKIYVSQTGNPGSASFSAAALTKGLSYNTVAQICGPYKTVGGHSGVRLWEDGPYFATCNIGASSPSQLGWYFRWGSTKEYGTGNDNGAATKYNSTDHLTKLETIDDAAAIEWGSGWRMPVTEEFINLRSKCDLTWKSTEPKGHLVTGKGDYAGISVFFPISFENGPAQGIYWSSSLSSNISYAYSLALGPSIVASQHEYDRSNPALIRPVID